MNTTKEAIAAGFREIADTVGALWSTAENSCSISKGGITVQVLWLIDGISGIFVTLLAGNAVTAPKHGYGLAYLVEFRGGSDSDLSNAKSDDLASLLELTKKYAVPFLDGSARDFREFMAFAEDRVRHNVEKLPSIPKIKTNKTMRAEWI